MEEGNFEQAHQGFRTLIYLEDCYHLVVLIASSATWLSSCSVEQRSAWEGRA